MLPISLIKVTVTDLEYVIKYLLLLCHSKRSIENNNPIHNSYNRISLFYLGLRVEKAMLFLNSQDFIDEIDNVCADLDKLITWIFPLAEIQKLKTAIRQNRHQSKYWSPVFHKYHGENNKPIIAARERFEATDPQ